MTWELNYTKKAEDDRKSLNRANLLEKAEKILLAMKNNPYIKPPPFEKLRADLSGKFSRRINHQHRIVYSIEPSRRVVIIYGMYSHYGE